MPNTISKDLTFGWRWANIEAVIEYLEAMPDQGTTLLDVNAERLKEGAIQAFAQLFAQRPLYPVIHEATGINVTGVVAFYNYIGARKTDAIHPPITRELQLHPDSDLSIHNIGVTFTVGIQYRLTGPLVDYDLAAVQAKYRL
jgi:hypothetical protein